MDDIPVSAEQAIFIEERVNAMAEYVIDCLDRAKAEGNNVLQWLFGVITGGMALIGTLYPKGYYALEFGTLCAIWVASMSAVKLVRELKSKETHPPGNTTEALNTMLNDTAPRMRWREACGVDERIKTNRRIVDRMGKAVDAAREKFASIPFWFIGGTVAAYGIFFFFPELLALMPRG